MNAFVYILANKKYGTLYIGVTSNLAKRIYEHKTKVVPGFTQKYGAVRLVYYEVSDNILAAIEREKQLKRWHRDWKSFNPNWDDLFSSIF